MKDYGHWNISKVGEFSPEDFFGFIYEITEIETGKSYIGRKQIKPKSKKANNWREYCSSSKELTAYINEKGKEKFSFDILLLCCGKSQLTYEEERIQFQNDVLRSKLPNGEKKYFNKTIGYRNFNGVEKQTELSRQKASVSNTGKKRSEEAKIKYSKSKKGIPKSPEHKEKLRLVNLNKKYSKETNSKKGKGPNGESLNWWNNGIIQIRSTLSPGNGWKSGRLFVNNERYILTEEQKKWIITEQPSYKEISKICNIPLGTAKYKRKQLILCENT